MASKPNVSSVRWADQPGANRVTPTSGERDAGFQAGTPASSGRVNDLLAEHDLWARYLSDGALVGDHTIAGSLTVGRQPFTFTDFTFTADNTTDQLAATGNPLDTGYGPVRLLNSGGGLPTGLATGTDYWWIKVDANHGKLASSLANALAGTFINFTTNGTGTHTVQHQAGTAQVSDETVSRDLTVGRNLTVTGTTTVQNQTVSGDLTIVGVLHHDTTSLYLPRNWLAFSGSSTAGLAPEPGGNLSPVWQLDVNSALLSTFGTSVDFVVGDAVAGFTLDLFGDGSGTTTYDLILNYYPTQATAGGSVVQIAHINGITSTASWATRTLSIDAPGQVLGAGGVLFLLVKVHSTSSAHTAYAGNMGVRMTR